ncbi:polysaccharide pyruvyl transferase family protein [Fibrobacter succinogenes]|uniref:polysaccharide pyruvyl transferase family protein n=1 Tax=Fibrobacter succinogenes TaxID=833 RepID=UPI001569AA8E|nr:polysaccharide pyruvyl transferase family protein [Fibrobacter succinogenes]
MKIGVVTFWETQDNYGQVLQGYALQKVLEQLGHEAFIIRYLLHNDHTGYSGRWKSIFSIKKVYDKIIRLFFRRKNRWTTTKVNRCFNDFKETYIKYSDRIYHKYKDLRQNPPKADAYIAGSDQIWYVPEKWETYRNILKAYFLRFANNNSMKLSYAASWGNCTPPDSFFDYVKPLLADFRYISVRENSGVEKCAKAGRVDAECVLDPTLLISKEHYLNLAQKPQNEGKYILLYFINNHEDIVEKVKLYAANNHLDIRYIDNQLETSVSANEFPTVQEWLGLIASAELVITDSYHGFLFSIIFNKRNIVVTNNDDRFMTVVKFFKLEKRIFNNNFDYLVSEKIDYEYVDEMIRKMRKKCISNLSQALDQR